MNNKAFGSGQNKPSKSRRGGFTLIELLVAGTIVGILAIYATIAYRNSVAETRLAAAKSDLELLANARQRFAIDYPLKPTSISDLTSKQYLEQRDWTSGYFTYTVCTTAASSCSSWEGGAWACMKGNSSKLPSKYRGSYKYCITRSGEPSETF